MASCMTERATKVANGKSSLKQLIAHSNNAPRDILLFKKQHELEQNDANAPRCEALLELLGLMKLSRGEMYRGLLESLVKQLEAAIPLMNSHQQQLLLERTFPFITISDHLRTIPLNLLKRQREIPSKYLNVFAEEHSLRDVLSKLPLSVQQQVWEQDGGFQIFEAHLAPIFESYRANLGQRHLSNGVSMSFMLKKSPTGRYRAKSKALGNLKIYIGSRNVLFDKTCELILKKYSQSTSSECGVWSSLLSDLLLAYEAVEKKARPGNIDRRLRCARVFDRALQDASLQSINVKEFLSDFCETIPKSKLVPVVNELVDMDLRSKLEALWDSLVQLDTRHVFAQAVTDEIAPNYSTLVKNPMDLSLIRTKIGKVPCAYSSMMELKEDVELMVNNCIKYNFKTSELGKYALDLIRKWRVEYDTKQASFKSLQSTVAVVGHDMSMIKPQPINELEAKCIALIVTQPEVAALLHHSMVSMIKGCVRDKKLPSNTNYLASMVQLAQLSQEAHRMSGEQALEIPPVDVFVLRKTMPLMAKYLGEASLQRDTASSETICAKDYDLWRRMFESALVRKLFLVMCAGSLTKGTLRNADESTGAHLMLAVLKESGGPWLAKDAGFLNGIMSICDKPVSVFRKKQMRVLLLDLLTSLVVKNGLKCAAYEVLISIFSLWGVTKHSEVVRPSAAASAIASASSVSESYWIDGEEVQRRLMGLSQQLELRRPQKRACVEAGDQEPLSEYKRLTDTFKGLDIPLELL